MKTHRMSRSAENRNASKDMAIRGRAGASRAELLAPDVVLSGRRFRRANGLTRSEAAQLDVFVIDADGTIGRPAITVLIDDRTRQILGYDMS